VLLEELLQVRVGCRIGQISYVDVHPFFPLMCHTNSINQFVTHDTGFLNRCNVPLDERNQEDATTPGKRKQLFLGLFMVL
jgi:hypothetical protein